MRFGPNRLKLVKCACDFQFALFERRFKLPETVTQEAISAGYANGVLTLTLPKKPEAKKPEPRKISIQR